MRAAPVRSALHALLICSVLDPTAHAADSTASKAETGATPQTTQQQDTGGAAGNANRDVVIRNAPIKRRDTITAGSKAGSSGARGAQPSALPPDGAHIALHGRNPLPLAHAYVSKPAPGAATRAYPILRPDAAVGTARANNPTLAAAGRPSAEVIRATSRPAASLKAAAGNGVLGGARATGRGTIGGPTNTASMIKAGINGTTLRPRS
jgi:hypothetical protein